MLYPGERIAAGGKHSVGIEGGVCTVPGELLAFDGGKFWVNHKEARYTPLLDDLVLGVVKSKGKDHYRLEIGAPSAAAIDQLDFPNATKRNRVGLSPGDVVLAQVVEDAPHAEVRVSARTEAATELGVLRGGILLRLGVLQCRSLLLSPPATLSPQCTLVFSMNGFCYASPPTPAVVESVLALR